MAEKIKTVCGQVWSDFLACAGAFVGFCGAAQSIVDVVNSFKPGTMKGLPTKADDKPPVVEVLVK